jgi:hypothetical protein
VPSLVGVAGRPTALDDEAVAEIGVRPRAVCVRRTRVRPRAVGVTRE